MLTKLRIVMAHHVQAAISSLVVLCRQPLATGMTVMVLAITLTLPALLWIFIDNMSEVTQHWKRGGHISLYLNVNTSQQDASLLFEKVQKIEGVGDAIFKTPADGLRELQHQEGMQDLVLNLPDNPLPAVIDVVPAAGISTPAQLEALYGHLKELPGIEDARLDMVWVGRLYALLDVASHITTGLMALLSLAVILIISNTLRLVIHKRYEEIQVLKLVGASNAYIMRPFLYSGLWYGLLSAILAVLLVFLFLSSLTKTLNQLVEVYQLHFSVLGLSIRQVLSLMIAAALLGWFGARFAVQRQLSSIEP